MGASLDCCNQRYPYVGQVFQGLNTFVVNLAPNTRIRDIAERGPFDVGNKLSSGASQDYDLVRSILGHAIKGVDEFRVILCGESEWSSAAVTFDDQHSFGVTGQPQAAISRKVVSVYCWHRFSSPTNSISPIGDRRTLVSSTWLTAVSSRF